jgi:hypothetical protein
MFTRNEKQIKFREYLPSFSSESYVFLPLIKLIKIFNTIILPGKHRLRVSENRTPRRTFGPKREEIT